jgi:hypothetical protein
MYWKRQIVRREPRKTTGYVASHFKPGKASHEVNMEQGGYALTEPANTLFVTKVVGYR